MKQRLPAILAIIGLAAMVLAADAPGARADLNLFGDYYRNVARAAAQNDAATVTELVGTGANPNQVDEQSRTGLHYAAMNGNLQIIAILIKASAKLEVRDKLGNTPLHLAADRNQTEAVKLLLEVGAAVDPQNHDGMTPLMMAASHGDLDIVRVLLAKGANAAKTDYTGRDAAGWAADSHRPAVVEAIKRAQNAKRS